MRLAVAFFHFMIITVLDSEHDRQNNSGDRCHRTKDGQQEHNNYSINPFSRFSIHKPPFMEVRMHHPLKGEPLTVLVMPKIIASEHMFDVNMRYNTLGLDSLVFC